MAAYVEVAVGLPVRGTYHYSVPEALAHAAQPGMRVLVPFGKRGVTGVVVRVTSVPPAGVGGVRAVREVLDDAPALDAALLDLCLWVADYYVAPPGEVLRAALPAGTRVAVAHRLRLTERGQAVLRGEAAGALPAAVVRQLVAVKAGRRVAAADLAALEAAGLAERADARLGARVRELRVATVRLARPLGDEDRRLLARAPRRAEVVAALEAEGEMDTSVLARRIAGAAASLRALETAGLVVRGSRLVTRGSFVADSSLEPALLLNPEQQRAVTAISSAVATNAFQSFLLFGVTGSGKTEVYLRAIAEVLAAGRGALVLVPEIALTPQLAARFRARFGDAVAVLHSGLAEGERFDQWRRLRAGEARIALGARSAVFAPVARLGIIVVDEEHDSSFKQEEGVRYNARDVALVRAQRAGAACVLGSATPALETFANAIEGRLSLLELPRRATAQTLPEVEIVDLTRHQPDPETLLSSPLRAALEATLAAGEQAILFLNRRGFATFVVCVGCGHAFRCPHCSVSLTYHRAGERLRCHYCGFAAAVPVSCPACAADGTIQRLGLGTERIEHALRERYPKARIGRLDRDTAAGRGLGDVLGKVAARELDILVGTQMVTKGHDFPGVTLVGVLVADSALSLPDFRAAERTFQLLTQVAGRAGRGERPGRVLIQSYAAAHPAIVCAKTHDYRGFFATESASRAELGYPPHGRLIAIRFEGSDEVAVRALADELAERVRCSTGAARGVALLGPAEAPLARLKGQARWHLWARARDRGALRAYVRDLVAGLDRAHAGVRVSVDVDPVSAL